MYRMAYTTSLTHEANLRRAQSKKTKIAYHIW